MAEYIEREATIREMKMDIEPPFKVVMKMPAVDVVPKSEVERLEGELIVESTRRKNAVNAYHDAKTEVAREIFEEIEKALNLSKCYGESGIYFEHDIETDIAELKKKYTEETE